MYAFYAAGLILSWSLLGIADGMNAYEDEPPTDCNTNPWEPLNGYDTVEDFERCAPFLLPKDARDYFQVCAGRNITCIENKAAYQRLRIIPDMLQDVSDLDTSVTVLGEKIKIPIGADPVAFQKLASRLGELDTVKGISSIGGLMILCCYANTRIEDIARAAPQTAKWLQIFPFENRALTINLVQRAQAFGFKAIVLTADTPVVGTPTVESIVAKSKVGGPIEPVNLRGFGNPVSPTNPRAIFDYISFLKSITTLPIVVSGILTVGDALTAAAYGANGILVSNHGGRQLDSVPATIDVLPKIADALKYSYPPVEVYVDGGVRNGFDIFKALARGARVVLVGRPIAWGLAAEGEKGIRQVFNILSKELKETMMLAGTRDVNSIKRDMVKEDIRIILDSDNV